MISSLALLVLIDVTVWVIMVDAMHRIWKLGNDLSSTFPNQKMLLLLVLSYSLHFLGQIVIFASTVYYEAMCRNLPVNEDSL